jgi:hypothetical protein
MLIIALIGVPIVLAYTSSIYYIFRGKVKLTHDYWPPSEARGGAPSRGYRPPVGPGHRFPWAWP